MRDVLSWSFSLGRWGGVQVRVHALFLLLAVFLLHAVHADTWPLWYALSLISILLVSLLWHEAAHVLAARRGGGHADQILIWPLGGLLPAHAPRDAQADLLVSVAGPLVNLLFAAAALPFLLILARWEFWQLINPLQPPLPLIEPASLTGYLPAWLALVFWVNWVLFLVNLLPASPLDGGRVLNSALWLAVGQRSVMLAAVLASQLTGLLVMASAWLVHGTSYGHAWAPLVILGTVLFFCARSEALLAADAHHDDDPLGYDFSQGYTSLERSLDADPKTDLGPVGRWLEERREAREQRQRQIEEDEERRMDDILARLHSAGLEGLSPEDRQILERISARYRNRQKR